MPSKESREAVSKGAAAKWKYSSSLNIVKVQEFYDLILQTVLMGIDKKFVGAWCSRVVKNCDWEIFQSFWIHAQVASCRKAVNNRVRFKIS